MIDVINFKGKVYPRFQSTGNASRFIMPYAMEVCVGKGVDVGCARQEWAFPGAYLVDPKIDPAYHATNFPYDDLDYIFSSHCLEHVADWVDVMDYWYSKLKVGGVLFLYLPDYSQEYWRPWNNRKHKNIFTPDIIYDYMVDKGYSSVFKSGVDLNNAFVVMGEKSNRNTESDVR
jgi:predicted SAM-dependent methyltransferase